MPCPCPTTPLKSLQYSPPGHQYSPPSLQYTHPSLKYSPTNHVPYSPLSYPTHNRSCCPQSYPASCCYLHPLHRMTPYPVYGGYLSRPWESLCGRHPFQGDFKQLIYYQYPPVCWTEWAQLYILYFASYFLLPLLLTVGNYYLVLQDINKTRCIIAALLFTSYYDVISGHLRNVYENYKQHLMLRSNGHVTFMQIVQSYKTSYNQMTLSFQ